MIFNEFYLKIQKIIKSPVRLNIFLISGIRIHVLRILPPLTPVTIITRTLGWVGRRIPLCPRLPPPVWGVRENYRLHVDRRK